MAGNSFGTLFRLTTFGESHGKAIGGVLDGCPSGLNIDVPFIQNELDRRKPGQSALTTQRKESDTIEILSGIFEGKSTGAPIAFLLRNEDQKPEDYEVLKTVYRPGHADYSWEKKFGIRDHRGGGRSSARETAVRVAGGAIAKLLLHRQVERLRGPGLHAQLGRLLPPCVRRLLRDVEVPVRCADALVHHDGQPARLRARRSVLARHAEL